MITEQSRVLSILWLIHRENIILQLFWVGYLLTQDAQIALSFFVERNSRHGGLLPYLQWQRIARSVCFRKDLSMQDLVVLHSLIDDLIIVVVIRLETNHDCTSALWLHEWILGLPFRDHAVLEVVSDED